MVVEDYSKIKDITFKVTDILSKDAKDKVLDLIEVIQKEKDRLHELRDEVRKAEHNLEVLEERFSVISNLIDHIEYETYEKDEVQNNDLHLYFKFDTEVNKHIG